MKYIVGFEYDDEYHYLVEYENMPTLYSFKSRPNIGQAMVFDTKVQAGAAAKILKRNSKNVGVVHSITERKLFEARLKGK